MFGIYTPVGTLRLQLVLNSLDDTAKEDFQNGTNGAVVSGKRFSLSVVSFNV